MATKNTKQPVQQRVSPATDEEKQKALAAAIAKIEKDYGKGTIMRLGDDIPVNVLSGYGPRNRWRAKWTYY